MIYIFLLVILYGILLRTRLPDLLKAILLGPVLAAIIILVGFLLYEIPWLSVLAMLAVVALCAVLLIRFRKPWTYFLSSALAALVALVALAYAWLTV